MERRVAQVWETHPRPHTDPLAAARDTAATLQNAASAYTDAFRADAGQLLPGINALTLGRLWEHVTGRTSKLPLTVHCRRPPLVHGRWRSSATRTTGRWRHARELALIEGRKDEALEHYHGCRSAGGGEPRSLRARFLQPTARLFGHAGLPARHRCRGVAHIDRAERQLDALCSAARARPTEPDPSTLSSSAAT